MRKALVCCLALLALGAAVPARAGVVYVPVVAASVAGGGTRSTEIMVANSAAANRNFSTTFLKGETDGTVRQGTPPQTAIVAGGALRFGSGAPADQFGLLEIDAAAELTVSARLVSTGAAGAATSRLPVISSANAVAAGKLVSLQGLERRPGNTSTDFYIVNLGKAAAQCAVELFRADGTQLVAPATVAVPALSMRRFPDVLNLVGQESLTDARAQVSCNQLFYVHAALVEEASTRMSFIVPAASGLSTLTGPGVEGAIDRPLPAGTSLIYQLPGVNLIPSREQEVRIINIPVEKALRLKRMVVELDFIPGPWHPGATDGPHAIIWLHRGTFRSNTIANVNVHGPNKNKIRMNQNIDLPGLQDTLEQQGGVYEQGKSYHFFYTYDAEKKTIFCTVTQGNQVINNLSFHASADNKELTVPATGLVAVLGHMSGLHYEVTSYGWTYSNLRISGASY